MENRTNETQDTGRAAEAENAGKAVEAKKTVHVKEAAQAKKTAEAKAQKSESAAAKAAKPKKKGNQKKRMKTIHTWLRFAVQVVFFLWFPAAFTSGFSGVKYIFNQMQSESVIELSAFVMVLIGLCAYTILFGRFFCGFACAFGTLGDWVHAVFVWVCRKLKKKPPRISTKITSKLSLLKYFVLVGICVTCYLGIYSNFRGTSPWDVFSMLIARNFSLGAYKVGVLLLVLILIGMCVQERFFCRFLCPFGALFSILPVLPVFSLRRDREKCIRGCSACTKQCPSDIELAAKGAWENAGDCFQCQKCIDTCPKGNISTGMSKLKGNEIVFTVIRAVLLAGMFVWLGL